MAWWLFFPLGVAAGTWMGCKLELHEVQREGLFQGRRSCWVGFRVSREGQGGVGGHRGGQGGQVGRDGGEG